MAKKKKRKTKAPTDHITEAPTIPVTNEPTTPSVSSCPASVALVKGTEVLLEKNGVNTFKFKIAQAIPDAQMSIWFHSTGNSPFNTGYIYSLKQPLEGSGPLTPGDTIQIQIGPQDYDGNPMSVLLRRYDSQENLKSNCGFLQGSIKFDVGSIKLSGDRIKLNSVSCSKTVFDAYNSEYETDNAVSEKALTHYFEAIPISDEPLPIAEQKVIPALTFSNAAALDRRLAEANEPSHSLLYATSSLYLLMFALVAVAMKKGLD